MKNIRSLCRGMPVETGGVGIEIEVEGRHMPAPEKTPYWSMVPDPSLRGGVEYVSRGALPINEIKTKALNVLFKAMKERGKINDNQGRCGLHVHVNVQELTVVQVYTALCAAFLTDGLLVEYCGPGRSTNLHCKPIRSTRGILNYLKKDAVVGGGRYKPFRSMERNTVKYSSINLAPLTYLGTIEFRAMRYLGEPELVDQWSTELHNMIHNAANTWKNPKKFLDWYLDHSKDELLNTLFSKDFVVKLKESVPKWKKLIDKNVQLTAGLAYSTDWDHLDNFYANLDQNAPRIPKGYVNAGVALNNGNVIFDEIMEG